MSDLSLHREWVRSPTGLILAEDTARLRYGPPKHPQGGDIFSGCGGFALGAKQAGIQMRFAVEWDVTAAITYMVNLGTHPCEMHFETEDRKAAVDKELQRYMKPDPKTGIVKQILTSGSSAVQSSLSVPGTDHMWVWDVSNLTGKMLLEPLGMEPGDLDFLHGSPPCQGFSTAGKQNPFDPRNTLMLEYARLITEIRPKAFTMEQVPNVLNMTTPDGQPMIEAFFECIENSGYASRQALAKMMAMQGHDGAVLRRMKNSKAAKPGKDEFETEPESGGASPKQGQLL
jgi:DNA (cytosine-5)-methyltransferase 1